MKALLSLADIKSVKNELIKILPNVKSSHRVEAMARGLGWNSNAHLRAELKRGAQLRSPDNYIFLEYLKERGFTVTRFDALEEAVRRTMHAEVQPTADAVITAEPPSSTSEDHKNLWRITMDSIELKKILEDAATDASEELIECADHLYHEHQAQEKYDTRKKFLDDLERDSRRAGDLLGGARDDMDDLYDVVSAHNPPVQKQISVSSTQLEYLKSLARVDHAGITFRAVEESDW